jgi:hypothetical protein
MRSATAISLIARTFFTAREFLQPMNVVTVCIGRLQSADVFHAGRTQVDQFFCPQEKTGIYNLSFETLVQGIHCRVYGLEWLLRRFRIVCGD